MPMSTRTTKPTRSTYSQPESLDLRSIRLRQEQGDRAVSTGSSPRHRQDVCTLAKRYAKMRAGRRRQAIVALGRGQTVPISSTRLRFLAPAGKVVEAVYELDAVTAVVVIDRSAR